MCPSSTSAFPTFGLSVFPDFFCLSNNSDASLKRMTIIKEIHKEYIDVRQTPLNVKQEDLYLFKHELKRKIRESHVLVLKEVSIINEIIYRFSPLNFYTSYTHPPFEKFGLKYVALNLLILLKMTRILVPKKKERVKEAVWITDRRSKEYFHWLTDALPRLMIAKEFISSHELVLPLEYERYSYITASLKLFDIAVKYCDRSTKLRIEELILPSHTAESGNYNKVVINQLRDMFLSKFPESKPYRRIYISRKKAKKRKVANEDEVIKLLESFNYEIHYFEDYSFDQQVAICSESASLIGLHGAGLTNMLFMRPYTQVLELRNENDCENNCYFSLASDLNIEYYYQLSKGDQNDTHTVNVNVDVNELRRNIENMLLR